MSPNSKNSLNTLINLRLGELEKRILGIVSELGEFTLRDIYKELGIDRRRALDAVKRLVEKGFVEKLERGVYRVAKEKLMSVPKDNSSGSVRGFGKDKSTSVRKDKSTGGTRRIGKDKSAGDSRGVVLASPVEEPRGTGKDKSTGDSRRKGKDKTTGEPRGLGKDNSASDSRGFVLASSIVEPHGLGKDKFVGDRFTKPMEDRFRIPSEEVKDKTAETSRGQGKDKPIDDQFTKPIEDQFRISSREANDKSASEQFTKTMSKHEIGIKTQTTETKPLTSITTTTEGSGAPAEGSKQPPVEGVHEIGQAYGGVGGLWAGTGGFGFLVHRLVLGFGFGVLPHFVFSVFGGCRRVEGSGQLVCRDVVGGGRVVVFEFNARGGGLVFLEASESPLSLGEFLGFVDWYLLPVFKRLTGREVSRSEFVVKAAPHLNSDLPGVYLEGVKSITLQDYYDEVVRKYLKKINGETYTRVEVEAKSWVNNNLEDVVNGLVTFAKLPVIASKLEKLTSKLEEVTREVEGGLSGRRIAAAVKTDLANLIYAFYLKIADTLINNFAPAIAPEIGKAVKESISNFLREVEAVKREHGKLIAELKKLNDKIEKLTRENTELKRKIEEYELAQKQMRFEDLPEGVKELLKYMAEKKLIEIQDERVMYSGQTWIQLEKFRYNFDAWLESVKYDLPRPIQHPCTAALRAIRFYDNRYAGKPGVPYTLWLKKFEENLKPLTIEQATKLITETLKTQKQTQTGGNIEEILREKLKTREGGKKQQ